MKPDPYFTCSKINLIKIKDVNVAAAAKLLRLCPTLCDPIDDSLPGSLVPGILQARTLEWVIAELLILKGILMSDLYLQLALCMF